MTSLIVDELMLHITCFRILPTEPKMTDAPVGNMKPIAYHRHMYISFEQRLGINDPNGAFCYHCKLKQDSRIFKQLIIYVVKGTLTQNQAAFVRSGLRRNVHGLVMEEASSPTNDKLRKVAVDNKRIVDTTIIGVINRYVS